MKHPRPNTQLFALSEAPPEELIVRGHRYCMERVFKHDFYTATALYQLKEDGGAAKDPPPRLVVKFGRVQDFCGLPFAWVGRWLKRREQQFHQRADFVPGIQRWYAEISDSVYALEFVPGRTLDTFPKTAAPAGNFFDDLRELLNGLHRRGLAYCDLHKRSNIVVMEHGRPALIDFQIALVHDYHAGWPWRWLSEHIIAYMQKMDLYHLYKHKRRCAPNDMRPEELKLAEGPRGILNLHRTLTVPLRQLRRAFLTRQHRSGRLVSPSAHLEDHWQPEKETWRK